MSDPAQQPEERDIDPLEALAIIRRVAAKYDEDLACLEDSKTLITAATAPKIPEIQT